MAFLRRLGWYLVGLSIGIVFLVFFFTKKSQETGTEFCYFPNCRVLKDMRSKPQSLSKEIQVLLSERKLDSTALYAFLRDGDINFGKSDTKSNPCKTYYIIKEAQELQVQNCPDSLYLKSLLSK